MIRKNQFKSIHFFIFIIIILLIGCKRKKTIEFYKDKKIKCEFEYNILFKQSYIERCYFQNGNVKYICKYKNNLKNGLEQNFYTNGTKKSTGNFLHGMKHGEFCLFNDVGILKEISYYKNDTIIKKVGYTEDKILRDIVLFRNGKENIIEEFWENGAIKHKCFIENDGNKQDSYRYYEDSTLGSILHIRKGLYHGEWKMYYESGNIAEEGQFYKGKEVGKWIRYMEDGEIISIDKYPDSLTY